MIVAALRGVLRDALDGVVAAPGRPTRRRTSDRWLLERSILPALARRPGMRRVLFVGCARYTQHYESIFAGAEYWTLDPVPARRRWGAQRHIADVLQRVDRHVPPAQFDLIVCNGVLGWGLDAAVDADAAFAACRTVLRPGGGLLLGWNDVAPRNRVRPGELAALAVYERHLVPGIGVVQARAPGARRHVYEFYCVRPADVSAAQGAITVGASGAGAHADSGRQRPSTHSS